MILNNHSKKISFILALIGVLLLSCVASMLVGALKLSMDDLMNALLFRGEGHGALVIWQIRLPRTLMVVLVGGALAVSGAMIQGIFRNPLADPALIGVSQGAALGAVLITIVGVEWLPILLGPIKHAALPIAAFVGGVATTWVVQQIGRVGSGSNTSAILLAGIAINALASAIIGLCQYLATEQQLKNIMFWVLGSFSNVTWVNIYFVAPVILLSLLFVPRLIKALNVLLLGESEARHLGFELHRTKLLIIVVATLLVAAGVATVGVIGFVGLVVPHIVRLMMGPDHRYLIPASLFLGAAMLLWADMAARTLVIPAEMPIGILTALVGGPFFIYLILKQKQKINFI